MGRKMKKGPLLRKFGTDLTGLVTRCEVCDWQDASHPQLAWARLVWHTHDAHPNHANPARPDEYAVLRWKLDSAVYGLQTPVADNPMIAANAFVRASAELHAFIESRALRGTELDPLVTQRKAWDRYLKRRFERRAS